MVLLFYEGSRLCSLFCSNTFLQGVAYCCVPHFCHPVETCSFSCLRGCPGFSFVQNSTPYSLLEGRVSRSYHFYLKGVQVGCSVLLVTFPGHPQGYGGPVSSSSFLRKVFFPPFISVRTLSFPYFVSPLHIHGSILCTVWMWSELSAFSHSAI